MALRATKTQSRLLAHSVGEDVAGVGAPSKYQALAPDAQMYGVFQPAYAQQLAAGAQALPAGASASEDAFDKFLLRKNAEQEAQRYGEALATANENQRYLQQAAVKADLVKQTDANNLDYVTNGFTTGSGQVADDGHGGYIVKHDPIDQSTVALENRAAGVGDRFKNIAGGVKDLNDAGYKVPAPVIGSMIAPVTQKGPTDIDVASIDPSTFTPDQWIEYKKALASGVSAQAALIHANAYKNKPPSGSGGPKTVIHMGPGNTGETGRDITITNSGSTDDPSNYINPKAVGKGSVPTATKATNGAAYVPSDSEFRPLLSHILPGVDINHVGLDRTQKRNDQIYGEPGHRSTHVPGTNPGRKAIDVPITKGYTFESVKQRFRDAGYNVSDQHSIDESAQPHTASGRGAHWHIDVSGFHPPQQQAAVLPPRKDEPMGGKLAALVQRAQSSGKRATRNSIGGVSIDFGNGVVNNYDSNGQRVQ